MKRCLLLTLLFFLSFVANAQMIFAQPALRQTEAAAKYEEAIYLVEELNLYEKDEKNILPRLETANRAILENQAPKANDMLNQILIELHQLQREKIYDVKQHVRKDWMESYFELIQKYILLILLAFLFSNLKSFKQILLTGRRSLFAYFGLSGLILFFAILLSYFDWYRYQVTAWTFVDIQLILLVIGSLVLGLIPGLMMGTCLALFRLLLQPLFIGYWILPILAGLLGGLIAFRKIKYDKLPLWGALAGGLIGLCQGSIVFSGLSGSVAWIYLIPTILLISFLEALGVYLFFQIVSFILRKEVQKETENQLLRTHLLFLQAQINPHFLFNTLGAIAAVCRDKDLALVERLILRLSEFLEYTLRRNAETVTLREEMKYIHAYLDIEKARMQDRLTVEEKMDLSEEAWEMPVPILLIQPLVENSIKYAAAKMTSGGKIEILAKEQGEDLVIEIIDNGKSADLANIQACLKGESKKVKGFGIGIRNIHERLIYRYGSSYGLNYEKTVNGGLKVTLRIPKKGKKEAKK